MRIHPAFVDLLASCLLIYTVIVGITIRNNDPVEQIHATAEMTLPKVLGHQPGVSGVNSAVEIILKYARHGQQGAVQYVVNNQSVRSLDEIGLAVKHLKPARIVIKGDESLPLSVLTPVLAKIGESQIPVSIAYISGDPQGGTP